MRLTRKLNLTYAEEFRIACTINNLRYEEVLQAFIDAVSLYAFLGGEVATSHSLCTQVIIDCRHNYDEKITPLPEKKLDKNTLNYIDVLRSLVIDPGLTIEIKAQKSFSVMESCSKDLLPSINYVNQLELNGAHVLLLTFDFNLLCYITNIEAQKILQYFIDSISMAQDRALNLYERMQIEPGTSFLLQMPARHDIIKKLRLPQEQIYVKYGLKLLELDERIENEYNVESKVKAYKAFYLDWYNALRVFVN